MGEMSLYTGIEDMLWPRIAKWRSVLVQKIHQLFGDLFGGMKKFFSPIGILRFTMLPTEIFGDLFRGEFGFANVAEVSGKVNGFSFH